MVIKNLFELNQVLLQSVQNFQNYRTDSEKHLPRIKSEMSNSKGGKKSVLYFKAEVFYFFSKK